MVKITKEMTFAEVLENHPQVGEVIMDAGLHCLGCSGAAFESIEQGCKMHGFDDEKVKKLVEDMNKKLEENTQSKDEDTKSEEKIEKSEAEEDTKSKEETETSEAKEESTEKQSTKE